MKKTLCILLAMMLFITACLPLTSAEGENYTFGNVDGKGDITASDALLALQFAVGKITLSDAQQWAANVDGKEKVTASDALMILQHAVGKIELQAPAMYTDYADYEYRYVEPEGLDEYTMYNISSSFFKDEDTKRNHDFTRLAVCIQGLINRNNDQHHVAVNIRLDDTDDFWLDFISEEGATYDGYTEVKIRTKEEFFDTFLPFIEECGIIAWDPDVPSTANIASTICGLENYLPVQYSTADGSMYQLLVEEYGVSEEMNLVGMFQDAGLGKKIADTDLDSTGSSKCDAYIWALDKYMEQCNPELLAYTPDGAVAVASNWLAKRGDASSAVLCGIPNHDYFIARQCFFFDLTSYGDEAPCDDPTQPLGTDPDTLAKILKKRYDMTGGMFGVALGFPPWHLKYTTHINTDALNAGVLTQDDATFDMLAPRLEWHFVEFVTSYNIGIEADAAHPCWMSNGSLYYKYEMRYEPKGNTEAKEETYDPEAYYVTVVWTGDFDCSPWMKARVPNQWSEDPERGNIAMTYGYNVNLSQRIPMAFDFIFSQRTDNDYLVGGEGMGYTFMSALFQGFEGVEATLQSGPSGFYGATENSQVKRTLPDGDQAYYNYAKPFYDKLGITTTARLINGFNGLEEKALPMLEQLSPDGVFCQASSIGSKSNINRYGDLVYMGITDGGGNTLEEQARWMYTAVKSQKNRYDNNFLAIGYCNPGQNWATASVWKQCVEAFYEYAAMKDPDGTYKYLDVSTFVDVIKQSDVGYFWDQEQEAE